MSDSDSTPAEAAAVGFPAPESFLRPLWRDRLRAAEPARLALTAASVVVAAIVGLLALRGAPETTEASLPVASATDGAPNAEASPGESESGAGHSTKPGEPVVAHAAGAVVRPGLYRLASQARVADLIAAAGGPSADADVDQLNLAAPVVDGERVYVPRRGEQIAAVAAPGGSSATGRSSANAVIDLNRASEADLDSLPGVGPATAKAIIEWRNKHGRFKAVRDLLDVRGIGPAKFAEIESRVRV